MLFDPGVRLLRYHAHLFDRGIVENQPVVFPLAFLFSSATSALTVGLQCFKQLLLLSDSEAVLS